MKFEEFINKIYTIAFRLTGDEMLASEIAVLAIERTASNINKYDQIPLNRFMLSAKEVCKIFILERETFSYEKYKKDLLNTKETGGKTKLLQNALLTLEPISRTAIVWKDILGFKIDDLVHISNYSKEELYCELNNGRRHLKSLSL